MGLLGGCSRELLNWRPATGAANSAYAIGTHLARCTRVYVLGFACGQRVERDRPAEFAAAGGDPGPLVAEIGELGREIAAALAALPPSALERRLRPAPELWGTGEPREISAREAIVESIRHAALHLGELRLTRDLAERHRSLRSNR